MAHLLNDPPPNAKRIITGWHSFDRAWTNQKGEIGVPTYAMELYGYPGCGKSTFAYSLAGLVAKTLDGNVALADIEGTDSNTVLDVLNQIGFENGLYWCGADSKKKKRKVSDDPDDDEVEEDAVDEMMLDDLISALSNPEKNIQATIFDSVGSISPVQELNNPSTSMNMGRRAQLMAKHTRKLMHVIRTNPRLCIYINHQHQNLGTPGSHTTGGVTLKYLNAMHIFLQRDQRFPKDKDVSIAFTLKGTITKDKFGYDGRTFYVFALNGLGVHHGLTAMYDCFRMKLIETSGRKMKVKETGEILSSVNDLVKFALEGQKEPFQVFYNLLKGQTETVDDSEEGGQEPTDTGEEVS